MQLSLCFACKSALVLECESGESREFNQAASLPPGSYAGLEQRGVVGVEG